MNSSQRPVVLCCPHSTKSIFRNVFALADRIGKSTHRRSQLFLQDHTTLTYLILCLSRISQICQNGMMHGVSSKRNPFALLHLAHFCPCERQLSLLFGI